MSATGKTLNYNLPIFNTGDSTAWADFNKAMTLLDDALKNIEVFSNNTDIKTNNNTNAISDIETTIESLQTETDLNAGNIANIDARTSVLEKHDNEQDLKIANVESVSRENLSNLELLSNKVTTLENMDLKAHPIRITSEQGSVNHSAGDCVEVYSNGDGFKLSIINAKLTFRPTTDVSEITFTLDSFNSLGASILDCLILNDYNFYRPAYCMINRNKLVKIYSNQVLSHEKEYNIYLNGVVIKLQ